ncbi:hypothetical protein CEXT_231191 [Caerostris extrusa]|uniref:Uncharacterized protein n=1 Tax=Caerostris extrusa TaxID=172846 RepID=A0AAV4RES1_CAEEX|nr:hypothetical protein CEXT_231191 [Caerostris extrusa]
MRVTSEEIDTLGRNLSQKGGTSRVFIAPKIVGIKRARGMKKKGRNVRKFVFGILKSFSGFEKKCETLWSTFFGVKVFGKKPKGLDLVMNTFLFRILNSFE